MQIAAGHLSLDLCPELGGAVAGFSIERPSGSFDLMRPLSVPQDLEPHALYAGMFPMVPFANSIRDNSFKFEGRQYAIAPNMPEVRLNYHGSGWQLRWRVEQRGASRADLVLEDALVDDAFRFTARQSFELSPDALAVELMVVNLGAVTMPFSCGLHPWFPRHASALVRFTAGDYWVEDGAGHAVALAAPDAAVNFSAWTSPPMSYQNKCFTNWSGAAEVFWPDAGIGLEIRGGSLLQHLMFHVPHNNPSVFCLEPQTNAPCAFDGLESGVVNQGVHLLAPGGELQVSVRFQVQVGGKAIPV